MKDKHFNSLGSQGFFQKNLFLVSCLISFFYFYTLVWVPFQKIPPPSECKPKDSALLPSKCSAAQFCSPTEEVTLLDEPVFNNWFVALRVSCADQSWFFNLAIQSIFAAKFIYCAFLSFLPDFYGRRPVMLFTLGFMLVFNALLLFVEDVRLFSFVFFLSSVNFLFSNVLVYCSEILPQRSYGYLASTAGSLYPAAGVVMGFVYEYFLDWEAVHVVCLGVLLFSTLLFWIYCPETPKFCLANQKTEEFKESIAQMAFLNGKEGLEESEIESILKNSEVKGKKISFVQEIKTNAVYRRDLLVVTVSIGVVRFVFNGTFMNIDKVDSNVILFTRVLFGAEVVANFIGSYFSNRFGRKTVLRCGFLLSSASFVLFYLGFNVFSLKIALMAVANGFNAMTTNVLLVFASETFDPKLRSTSFNFSILLGNGVNAFIPYLMTSETSFLLFACLQVICFFLINIPKETLKAEETEKLLELNTLKD